MHNTSGMLYRIIAVGLVLLILGIFCFAISKRVKKPNWKSVIGIGIILFSLAYIAFFTYKFKNPSISTYEGYYMRMYRDSTVAPPLPFTYAYVFDNEESEAKTFYLDTFSKKAIIQSELSSNIIYRITFDQQTKVILKIEPIE